MPFIIMSEKIGAPKGSSRGRQYRRVAVVETNLPPGETPSRIDARARGVVRIVEEWRECFVGKTRSSSFYAALDEAEELVRRLIVERAIELKRHRLATMENPK